MNTAFVVGDVQLALRPAETGDTDFLYRVYASTRVDEMALVDWSDDQKTAFLKMQFNAQTVHYKTYYPTAEYFVLECGDTPIGRVSVERTSGQLRMMDLALLPEYRNRGIGTAVIRGLMDEAAAAGIPMVLSVEFFNPAFRLYTRLGFVKTRELNDVYYEMVWTVLKEKQGVE